MREFESVLHLNREDAARFYNAYYYPDESLRIQNAQAYDRITSDVATRQTQNGFVGSIRGLDLSFLDSVERVADRSSVSPYPVRIRF